MNIGLLGGTFDPVHNGHIAIAETVKKRMGLEEVIFMPAAITPLKDNNQILAAEHRTEMVRLAISGKPYLRISMIEINRTGPSYTIDTMLELRDMTGDENEIFFILGFDSLAGFPRWKDPERLIQLCRLVAVPRPGCAVPDLATLEKEVPGLSKNIIIMDEPHTDISATKIRDRVAKGLSIRQLVPTPVEEYIRKHKLYLKR